MTARRLPGSERGMVLLVVLLIVALLVTLLVEFAFSTLVDLRLAETYRDTTRAAYLARGGITVGRTLLNEDGNGYDGFDELWAQGIEGYPVADGTVSIRIEDHGGRFDLNRLVGGDAPVDFRDRYEELLRLLAADDPEALTDALIDWIDGDDVPERAGAENAYYRSLPEPYNCRNDRLESVEELLLVRGYDRQLVALLAPHVTVHGDAKLNVNTASAEVLQVWNRVPGSPDAGETIVAARQRRPFTAVNQVNELPGLETFLTANLSVTSDDYRIEATAFVNDGRRTIRANVRKNGGILYKRAL